MGSISTRLKNILSREELEKDLADSISETLRAEIEANGSATLLVSGGSTPKGLFLELSKRELDWSRVSVLPVDERFLDDAHADQNGNLIKQNLLINKAAQAQFIPLVLDSEDEGRNLELARHSIQELNQPYTVVILGMGADGHTASLFPDCPELESGMDLGSNDILLSTHPSIAPYARISFSRAAILSSKRLILHLYGQEKKDILQAAQEGLDWKQYPIAGFIQSDDPKLELYWTE